MAARTKPDPKSSSHMSALGDVVLRALREEIHELKVIGREQNGVLHAQLDVLSDIRDELRAAREERAKRHGNGHAEALPSDIVAGE